MRWFRKKKERKTREAFDWAKVPAVDPGEVDRWMGATDVRDRQFPLKVALQVHDEVERILMKPGEMSALRMAELRGQMMALSRFAKLYSEILNARNRETKGGDDNE